MEPPVISLIHHLITTVRSGGSTVQAVDLFKLNHPKKWQKLRLSSTEQQNVSVSSVEYELMFILERGAQGFPVLSALNDLNLRAHAKLHNKIDLHTAKTPFLALIPLFTLQTPSLMLIFIYPLLSELLGSF